MITKRQSESFYTSLQKKTTLHDVDITSFMMRYLLYHEKESLTSTSWGQPYDTPPVRQFRNHLKNVLQPSNDFWSTCKGCWFTSNTSQWTMTFPDDVYEPAVWICVLLNHTDCNQSWNPNMCPLFSHARLWDGNINPTPLVLSEISEQVFVGLYRHWRTPEDESSWD